MNVKHRKKRNANFPRVQNQCLTPQTGSGTAAIRFFRVAVPVLVLMLASVSVNAQSPAVGYRDFSFGTTVTATPSGEKPESKLWFNDGVWWGSMFSTTTSTYHIYRFNPSTQSWTDTGTQLDNRPSTKADCLWDGSAQKLYITSHIFTTSGTSRAGSGLWGRLYRYSYQASTQSYTLDSGFPVTVNKGNSETLVVAKDTTGVLWVTFTQASKVYVNHSAVGNDTQWGTPFLPPTNNSDTTLTSDDISSVIAFGPGNIGVMWSNQLTTKFYFMVHKDADPDTVWQPEETAFPGPGVTGNYSDDHINLKTDNTGRVFAAVKTSLTSSTDPLSELLVRATDGTWSSYIYGLQGSHHSRAIVLLDLEHNQLYMFAVSPEGMSASPQSIYYKTTSLNVISFPPGLGVPFIQNATDITVNNASSTKQNVDSTTGLLVISSDANTRYYQHNFLTLTGGTQPVVSTFSPTADPPGSIITITGSGFTAVSVVAFNGQAAQFTVNSDTQITATEPNGATTGPVTVSTQSGLVGTSSASFNVTGTPHISSFTPTSGPVGTVLTLNGSGFTGTTSVTFNGVSASFSIVQDSKLTAVVPAGATTGPIQVTNPAGTGTSSSNFVVTVPVTITSFTPTSGPVGTIVTITGSNFTGATAVTFAGIAAGFTVNSDTQITATVPTGATTGAIQVTNPQGTGTSSSNFVVIVVPSITSFTPTNGPAGTTVVTITGTGFTGTTGVSFAGTAASFTVNSDTQITATVPATATTGAIQVTNPAGTGTSSSNFVVTVVPVITSFTPTSGPVGTVVTITGSGFTATTKVTFNTVVASFTVNSDTQITATVPSSATTGLIRAQNSAGTGASSSNFVVTLAPAITSFTPTDGPVGTTVTITGSNFTGTTAVSFAGVAASFTVNSSTKITATVPTGAQSGVIQVTNSAGTGTSSSNFVVTVVPVITSFTPTSGPVGTVVTITGSGFTATTKVTFNTVVASFTVNSDTQITATVPSSATTGLIRAQNSAGTGASSSNFVITSPWITSFTPASGPVGATVTITGGSFTGATTVTFAGTAAIFTVNSDTKITATVPAGATTGPIQVTNPAGTGTSSSNFVVTIVPVITSFTPTSGLAGTTVTITGSAFTGATAVTFAGIAAGFTVNSDTQITATVPSGATTGAIQVTNAQGTGTSSSNFVVIVVPSITSFTPTNGPAGTTVIITGSGFTGTTGVTFAGTTASFTLNSDTQITATVPASATTGAIQVTNPAGTGTSASSFVVTLPPTISFLKSAAAQNTSSSGITSLSVPVSTSGNDLLVAFVAQGTSGTDTMQVSDSAGNTWTNIAYDSYSATNRSGMFYSASAAAVTSITVTFSTSGGVGNAVIVIYEIAGAASSSVSDGSAVAHNATAGTSLASGSLTTTNANDIILYGIYTPTTTSAWVAGTGFSFPTGSAEGRANMDYAIVSSTQSGLSTITSWTNSSKCSSIIAAFKQQ